MITDTDPFTAGDQYPNNSTIRLKIRKGFLPAGAVLANVCTFPALGGTGNNDNGGTASPTAWTLTAAGTGGSPTNLLGTTPVNSGDGFLPDTYTLGETGPSGYTPGTWNCVYTGTTTVVQVTNSQVTVGLGEDVTCTINNDDNTPALHLIKTVTGAALPTSWTLTATGIGTSPTNLSGSTPVNSDPTFKADTYTLAESGGPGGYAAGPWNCVLTGTTTVVPVTDSQVTVGLG